MFHHLAKVFVGTGKSMPTVIFNSYMQQYFKLCFGNICSKKSDTAVQSWLLSCIICTASEMLPAVKVTVISFWRTRYRRCRTQHACTCMHTHTKILILQTHGSQGVKSILWTIKVRNCWYETKPPLQGLFIATALFFKVLPWIRGNKDHKWLFS